MLEPRLRTVVRILLAVSLVLPCRAQVEDAIDLPAPTGSFAVGTFTHEWRDLEREDDFVTDREYLAAAFTVWYPAEPVPAEAERAAYDPQHDALLTALEHSFAGVPISTLRERYPVVLLSPGGNVSRRAHTALAEELASHGYVVCAVSHPYSGLDLIAGELHASHSRWDSIDGDDEAARRADEALCDHLAADSSRALDRLTELAAAPGNPLANRVATSRVAILGHSRGGSTVGRACSRDARFRAAIVLDNIGPDQESEAGLDQPHLTMRTDAARRWNAEGIDALRVYLSLNRTAGYEVVIQGAAHMSFTDIPFAVPDSVRGSLATERVHELTSLLVRAFLARHLAGTGGEDREDGLTLEELADASAEVVLTVLVEASDD